MVSKCTYYLYFLPMFEAKAVAFSLVRVCELHLPVSLTTAMLAGEFWDPERLEKAT